MTISSSRFGPVVAPARMFTLMARVWVWWEMAGTPFICRQLIQFLVSSNSSLEFVARVSAVFVDNGSGGRGDLGAVVKAILLDEEARNPMEYLRTSYFGHLREP